MRKSETVERKSRVRKVEREESTTQRKVFELEVAKGDRQEVSASETYGRRGTQVH